MRFSVNQIRVAVHALLILGGPVLFVSSQQQRVEDRSDWTSSLSDPFGLPDLLPGNGFRSGTRLWVYSALNTGGNEDCYRFYNVLGGTVTIRTTGDTDTNGRLYNDAGDTLLAENEDRDFDNGDYNFELSFQAEAATYYKLCVAGYDASVTGDYDLFFDSDSMEDYGNGYYESYTVDLGTSTTEFTWDGTFDWVGDKDAFWFWPQEDGTLTVWTSGSIDTVATLYGTDENRGIYGDELGFWDDYGGINFRLTYDLVANTEFWLIAGTYADGDSGPYQITFSWSVSADPFSSATNIGELKPGLIGFPILPIVRNATLAEGEIHYYYFDNILASTNVVIRSEGNVDVKSSAYDASRNIILSDDNSGTGSINFNYAISADAFSRYFVTVEGSSGTETGQYSLIISTTATEDYGNIFERAFEIVDPVNGTLAGVIDYNTDIDMFKFVAPGNGLFIAGTITSGIDSYGYLYNANGEELARNDDTNGWNFEIRYTIVEGNTYYLRVNSYGFYYRFSYLLKFTFPNRPLRTTTTRTPTPTPRLTTTTRSTTRASTTSTVKPDNNLAEQTSSAAVDASGIGGLIAIFVGVILGTIVLAGTVGFFVLRAKFPTNVTMTGATTTMTSAYPTITEKSGASTVSLPMSAASMPSTAQMMALQQIAAAGNPSPSAGPSAPVPSAPSPQPEAPTYPVESAPVTQASEASAVPVMPTAQSMAPSYPVSTTQTVIDVATVNPPSSMQATMTEGKVTLEQFSAAVQMPLFAEFAQKGVTLDQLKVMTLNDLVPHGITQEDYLKIRTELKNQGLL